MSPLSPAHTGRVAVSSICLRVEQASSGSEGTWTGLPYSLLEESPEGAWGDMLQSVTLACFLQVKQEDTKLFLRLAES